ncbi:thiosulfate sulfurtransferase/rhodanese-like domain-containing protein 3 [Pollicipes pollicipes]|uniref:thiosulfate sulfurtransferase/rhodanese-like domain-containing protein 3 n=1 Tax=Pollicipes pollicipes TaxID=41117 RepID=UPI001884BF50|nr:thiosulfate sulfurtransferase/rhodanese-like domain-containing protein 3 [Pollicipes pollicipes]
MEVAVEVLVWGKFAFWCLAVQRAVSRFHASPMILKCCDLNAPNLHCNVAALVGGPAAGRAAPAEWPGPYPGIAFEELQPLVRANAIFLLDVRNRSELLDQGRPPNSHNLPLHELNEALTLTAAAFREKYGFVLPPPEQEMVLMCYSGLRAEAAAAKMIPAGYGNLRLYYGSFKDWARRGAPVSREIPAETCGAACRWQGPGAGYSPSGDP